MSFTLLVVCTGNICRSPMAERLLQARIDGRAPITISSAGVTGLVGHPMDGPSARVLRELGGDPTGHLGRRLSQQLVSNADLILTADSMHRSVIVQADPIAFRRVFTLREFGRLGGGMESLEAPPTVSALRDRVAAVAGNRGNGEPAEPGGDDIGDPFGAPMKIARATGEQVSEAVDAVLAALGVPTRR